MVFNVQANRSPVAVICSLILLLPWQLTFAAEDSIQIQLEATRALVQQLDELAQKCLNRVQQTTTLEENPAETPCLDFSDALNGNLLVDYINHCRSIKNWRDQFIDSRSDNSSSNDADALLELMIDSEFLCGEDALIKRTEFVGDAYQHVSNANRSNLAVASEENRELRALSQQMLISRERNRLMNSFQQQQQRQQFETQRQLDRQELELIRQQIVPPAQRR